MSEGPTTVGAIDGRVTLDIDDFKAKIEIVKAKAAELAGDSPTIKVDADTAGAQASLAAVDAAAGRLGLKEGELAVAERAAADGADKQAKSASTAAAATRAQGDAAAGAAGRCQLMIAAVVALVALAAPLGAAMVGLGGAMTGMGAAGVLAIIGVVAAIKQGTAAGQQWSDGLQALKADLGGLANTAAVNMLHSFQQAVGLINSSMPALNQEIGQFARGLGTATISALTGVINCFHILNPLFMQGVGVIMQIAAGFSAWTQSGGLQTFATYASHELPVVVDVLGHLASAVINVVVALAPLGGAVLSVIDAVAGLLTGLSQLGPVLSILTGAVLAGFAAFKLWGIVAPLLSTVLGAVDALTGGMTALGIAVDSAMGPIGWVAAGVAALAAAFAIGTSATQDNTAATNDYTAALIQSKGALDDTVRAQVAKNLSDSGALDIAKRYGLALSTVTDAVMGNKDALDLVNAAIKQNGYEWVNNTSGQKIHQLTDDGLKLKDSVNGQSSALHNQAAAFKDQESAAASSVATLEDLSAAEATAQEDAQKLTQALQNLGSVNMDVAQAQIQFKQSVADATAAIKKNGATLNENSQAGRDNSSALLALSKAGHALVATQSEQHASEGALQATMAKSRAAFIQAAMAAGDTRHQAELLADKYKLIPKDVATLYRTTGYQAAMAAADRVRAALAMIPRHVVVSISTTGSSAQMSSQGSPGRFATAYGGTATRFGGMAEGGTVGGNGSAWSDTAGLFRLAFGEEVTSNTVGQASTWRSVLKAINANAPAGEIAGRAAKIAGVSPAPVMQAAPSMPSTLVVVDADGALIGRMRVEASAATQRYDKHSARRLEAGRQL